MHVLFTREILRILFRICLFWVRSHCFTLVIGSPRSAKDGGPSGTGSPPLPCFNASDKMPHSSLLEKSNAVGSLKSLQGWIAVDQGRRAKCFWPSGQPSEAINPPYFLHAVVSSVYNLKLLLFTLFPKLSCSGRMGYPFAINY